jgi:hypothetical protein
LLLSSPRPPGSAVNATVNKHLRFVNQPATAELARDSTQHVGQSTA